MPQVRRSTVSTGARLMLPLQPALGALIGCAYTLGAPDRTATPSFDVARSLVGDVRTWGLVVFLPLAILMAGALLSGRRQMVIFSCLLGAVVYAAWAVVFGWALLTVPSASFVAPGIYLYVSCSHVATASVLFAESEWRA